MKKIMLIFIFVISFSFVSASYTMNIGMKDVFEQGEIVKFNYTLDLNLAGEIEYTLGVKCDDFPDPLLEIKKQEIAAGEIISGSYEGFLVDKNYRNCLAFVSVLSPIQREVSKSFNFLASSIFSFNIKICKDSSCEQESKIFLKNESIKAIACVETSSAQKPGVLLTHTP